MKYWKEKESNLVESMQYWQGTTITKLEENEIFVMGTNPSGIHGAGAAKAGLKFGAKMTVGRGLMGSTYGLITKNLEGKAGFVEKATGIVYDKEGYRSVSTEQIRANIDEMYDLAKQPEHQNKKFLVSYQYETWPNGTPKKGLNGYTSQEMLEMFVKDKDVPPNIVFHDSYKPHLEKLYKNQNKQSNGELVVFEDGKTIDIKEEDIVWTIDTDERNPQGINGAGAAKAAMSLSNGAKHGIGRGFNGSNAYALVTKSLNAGFLEKSTGILYDKEGYCSVSPEQIRTNIDELYEIAKSPIHKDKKFLVSYQYESWPNGTPKKSLNGYTSQEMLEMFVKDKDVPPNIVFHESYKPHLEKLYKNTTQNNQTENINKEYTFFFHLTSPFSNFHPARFEYKNFTFISNEQFMMFSKAKTFGDEETANRIINIFNEFMIEPRVFKNEENKLCFQLASSFKRGEITTEQILKNKEYYEAWNNIHKKIKALGREVKNYDDNIWSEKREKVVFFGAREKFNQNANLKQILLDTKNSYLVEASPYDKLSTMEPNIQKSKEYSLMLPILQKLKEEFLVENKERNKLRP